MTIVNEELKEHDGQLEGVKTSVQKTEWSEGDTKPLAPFGKAVTDDEKHRRLINSI
jgi:hypothetical protein